MRFWGNSGNEPFNFWIWSFAPKDNYFGHATAYFPNISTMHCKLSSNNDPMHKIDKGKNYGQQANGRRKN